MPLQRGEVLGYDFNRMVVDFTMSNHGKTVRCAISTAAMDNLESKYDVKADQRVDQFVRLRDAIEERASRKFSKGQSRLKDRWCCDPTISSSRCPCSPYRPQYLGNRNWFVRSEFFRVVPIAAVLSKCREPERSPGWSRYILRPAALTGNLAASMNGNDRYPSPEDPL